MTAPDVEWIVTTGLLISVGLWALVWPGSLVQASRKTARRIHLPYARWLDKTLYVDRVIYRFHRGAGAVIWLASCITLYISLFVAYPGVVPAVWWNALVTLTTLAGVIGFAFGIVMILRPSAVKPLEAWGNRWVDMPEHLLDRPVRRLPVEQWAAGHTRLFGLVVLAAGLLIAWLRF